MENKYMIIRPKIRGFVCTTAHPKGCEVHVLEQINYIKKHGIIPNGPKKVLIIGASTGYGLASRISMAFGSKAKTLGVFFEKEPSENSTATAGWYNSIALEKLANAEGLYAKSINGDAFSDAIKAKTIECLKEIGPVDLVIYSIASPRRVHPKTGEISKSVLKPIGHSITSKTLDTDKAEVKMVSIEAATEQEIQDTITVMGGEDWELWMEALDNAGLLAKGCQTIAYTYLGAKPTWSIYGHGSIGRAKLDLERATKAINQRLVAYQGSAYIGVMKAIVTQASSAIPIMPLYISLLYKIMKEKNTHEACIQQICRLFTTQLYGDNKNLQTDEADRIRMDDLELQPDIQNAVEIVWEQVTTQNLHELTDFKGYQADFLKLFGFGFQTVNYEAEVNPVVTID
jgi:enoyl-[acyl-carrier protein] reductase/trans-2-enoyl-CoA reductase (NAD+)